MKKNFLGDIELTPTQKRDYTQQIRDLKAQIDILERLFHFVPEGIILLDAEDRVILINQSAKLLLHLEEWKNHESMDLSTTVLSDIFQNTRKLDFLSYHREIEILDPNLKYLSVSCIPFPRGEDLFFRLFFIKDITSKKISGFQNDVNPNFIDTLTFGAGIAHELGNPIAGLSLHAQLLDRVWKKKGRREEDNTQIQKSIDVLNRELTRLDETIHEFLDAVRPVNPQFFPHLIQELIKKVMSTLTEKARQKNVELCFHSDFEEDPILVDGLRIQQALTNVILNAIEFSPENSKVDIFLNFKKENCEIRIKDYGPGISPAHIGKIFDPYFTTKESGNGLGLLITYRIIRDHGGTITVKSKPKEGTTFILSIPLRKRAIKELPCYGK